MNIVYMIPFLLTEKSEDIQMAKECFNSLERIKHIELVIYNQGSRSNEELLEFMKAYTFSVHIIGTGQNDGIAMARHESLEYIGRTWPEVKYIAEVHVDMIFTPHWQDPLIEFLEMTEEPMVCPRILAYQNNRYQMNFSNETYDFPSTLDEKIRLLESLQEDRVEEAFVHPVIHRAEVLRQVYPYDIRFLTGKQGFEDDSLLLGYHYYMGTKQRWRPKMCMRSCVYHKTLAQRMDLTNIGEEMRKNYIGLGRQYGAYGFKELAYIHNNPGFEKDFEYWKTR